MKDTENEFGLAKALGSIIDRVDIAIKILRICETIKQAFISYPHKLTEFRPAAVLNHIDQVAAVPLQYFVCTKGMGETTPFLGCPRTTTVTSVPFLWKPDWIYPIAMFFPSVGEGIPDVMTPV